MKAALEDPMFDVVLDAVDFSTDTPTADAEERAVHLGHALLAHPTTVPITLSRPAPWPSRSASN